MSLFDFFSGWVSIDPNTELKVGDEIKELDRGKNTGVLPADDDDIINGIYSVSDKEITDEIESQTGAKIEILSRNVDVVNSGWEWTHTTVYKIKKASPINPALVAGIIIALFALVAYLISVKWALDATMIKTPWGEISIFGILFAAVLAIVAITFIKSMLE